MDRIFDSLKNMTKLEDVRKLLYELLSQPDILGYRELADYAQPCDFIRFIVSELDDIATLTLIINAARKMIEELNEQDINEHPAYVVQLILTAPVLNRQLIDNTLHLLEKANRAKNPQAKKVYIAVLGVIVGEKFEISPEWWEVQARTSMLPLHLLNAYVQLEGWKGVATAFNLVAEKKLKLSIDDLLVLIDIALRSFLLDTDKIWKIVAVANKMGCAKLVEERLGDKIRGNLLRSTEDYKILETAYTSLTVAQIQ